MTRVDLNCDLGEGAGHDEELLSLVTSANVACGVHAGDMTTMQRTVALAREYGVAVGAHPGFADRAGFGRRAMTLPPGEVFDLVVGQVASLRQVAEEAGVEMQHVKPHGALYNIAATDPSLADAIARAAAACDERLILFGLAGSELIAAGERAGLATAAEAFADRIYEPDGTLTPRTDASGGVHGPDDAVEQAIRLATDGTVVTRYGSTIAVTCDTICIHGDTAGAPDVARMIRSGLEAAGVEIKPISS